MWVGGDYECVVAGRWIGGRYVALCVEVVKLDRCIYLKLLFGLCGDALRAKVWRLPSLCSCLHDAVNLPGWVAVYVPIQWAVISLNLFRSGDQ